MKRIVSVLVMIVMLVSVAMVPAYARSLSEMFPQFKYIEKYEEKYGTMITDYDELYFHYEDETNTDSAVDWVLIRCARTISEDPGEAGGRAAVTYAVVGDVVFNVPYYYEPFETGYAIYDVEKDVFIDLFEVKLEDYEGLSECLVMLSSKIGRLIGDMDGDGGLSIIDATGLQLCIAKVNEFERDVYGGKYSWIGGKSIKYMSDVDRDGERTIMDATEIQRKLARIE